MGQICLKDPIIKPEQGQSQYSLIGKAKRADNFEYIRERAGAYQGYPLSRLDLMRAASIGTPALSDGARALLNVYLCHLDTRRLGEGLTAVWPGNECVGEALGKKDPTIRRLKGELEREGYILRLYDRRNRPLERGAIDLSPFLQQAPDIIRDIDKVNQARKQKWLEAKQSEILTARSQSSGDPLENERLNSTSESYDSCLEGLELKKDKDERTFDKNEAILEAKQAFDETKIINQALQLSPKLREHLDPDGQGISTQLAAQTIWSALPKLFPDDSANSISHTFLWCTKRHGAKAFLYLAIALEDPTTKSARALFGWFATNPEKIDVSRNLERIKHKPKAIEPEVKKPKLPGNGFEDEIGALMAQNIGIPAYNAWFDPASIRFSIKADELIINHASPTARKYIKDRFAGALKAVAMDFGCTHYRIDEVD